MPDPLKTPPPMLILTEAECRDIAEREALATPGPWSNVDTANWAYPCVFIGEVPAGANYDPLRHRRIAELSCTRGKVEREIENADFIAHARQDIPNLLATVAALREELRRLRAGITS